MHIKLFDILLGVIKCNFTHIGNKKASKILVLLFFDKFNALYAHQEQHSCYMAATKLTHTTDETDTAAEDTKMDLSYEEEDALLVRKWR